MTDKTCGRCGGFGTIKVPRGGFEYSEYPCAECTVTDLTAEQRADLNTAEFDSEVIIPELRDEIARLQRELTEAQDAAEYQCAQLASAVARIAELGAENGRLFHDRNEAQKAWASEAAAHAKAMQQVARLGNALNEIGNEADNNTLVSSKFIRRWLAAGGDEWLT